MNILKCKMCGGDIEVSQDMTVGTCLYCGSTMTLPRIDSEKKARIFNRANEYRLNNEFDKAFDAYKSIVEEDETESEAYWGQVLSEYGVEYVKDPSSHKRIPTCHRTKVQSVLSSVNYKMALKYADAESKFVYQDEAEVIDKLQKKIISISAKEKPYDVFICYKENDINGERTKESVVGQNIYDDLMNKGIRCFFARISLEEHIGENYEPYIYSALNSAKIMIVLASESDNCSAVWVKNEWMRYLNMMEEDKNKVIIPAYIDMSPYEFPSELSSFQAQDMSKVGAIQDLTRGITKILGTSRTESDSDALNELISDKKNREKKSSLTKKILLGIGMALMLVICAGVFYIFGRFNHSDYELLSRIDMLSRFRKVYVIFFAGIMSSLLVSSFAFFISFSFKDKQRLGFICLDIGLVLCIISTIFMKLNSFSFDNLLYIYIIHVAIALSIVFKNIKRDKIVFTIISLCLVLCSFILYLVPEKKLVICNPVPDSENTVRVVDEYCNLRKEPNTNSTILSELYEGMVFNIEEEQEHDGYKWYKITTANGISGYVREDVAPRAQKIYVSESSANVRTEKKRSSDLIKVLYYGEELWGYKVLYYYEVCVDGQTGYVISSAVSPAM